MKNKKGLKLHLVCMFYIAGMVLRFSKKAHFSAEARHTKSQPKKDVFSVCS